MNSTNPTLIIQKKRDGKELTGDEIQNFIRGLMTGDVADYQASAFLMAVFFRGMSLQETVSLTRALLESGEKYDLTKIQGPKVDKHSTGGVGDKVSHILAPLASACGLKVPMMSGRGLGHSGGTLDKLESISGFDVHLSRHRFEEVLAHTGCAMIGQSEKIVPADKKLYALRDVTGTVECIPLITASILSKKLAEGTRSLVLDVKIGNGAFMKSKEQGKKLANSLLQVGKKMGLPCRAVLTQMNQPLGYAVGNSLEMKEAIELLRNEKSDRPDMSSGDLKELTIQLCAHMLELGGITKNITEGRKLAFSKLADGSAWKVFQSLVQEQGGKLEQILDLKKLPISPRTHVLKAKKRGYITQIQTETMGHILIELGGGRKKTTDSIDPSVGLVFHKKLGAKVNIGDPLVTVHSPEKADLDAIESVFYQAIEINGAKKPVPKLILETF